jgi:hypothetical protein
MLLHYNCCMVFEALLHGALDPSPVHRHAIAVRALHDDSGPFLIPKALMHMFGTAHRLKDKRTPQLSLARTIPKLAKPIAVDAAA